MLNFLRKIRRSLIQSGATSKYAIYAVGEIALVVIGILIALQINNWNEIRKSRESTKIYLQAMIEDLNDDIAILKRLEENHLFRFYGLNYILKYSGKSELDSVIPGWTPNRIWNEPIPNTYNKEFLKLSFTWFHRTGDLEDYNSSSFEEMNNIGLFSFINNKPLKTSLKRYYKRWDWRLGPRQWQKENEWIEKWYEVLAQDGIYHNSLRDMTDPLSQIQIAKYPYREVILSNIRQYAAWRYNTSIILQEDAKGLINQIMEEIEKY